MRKTKLTRRSWLAAAAVASVGCRTVCAQELSASVDNNRQTARGVMPIACRSVQLDPVVSKIDRTVITAVAADPRGQLIAAAGDDHAIRILEAASLRKIQTLQAHRDLIRTLTFDPAGEKLVSAGNDGQLIVWDRQAKFQMLQRMKGTPAIACVRFSPDGNEMAAVGFDRQVYLIGRGGKANPTLQCDCNDLRAVAYRDDNQILAIAGRSGDLQLFDPRNGDLLGNHTIHRGRIHAMEFQRHAPALVSAAEDGTVVVFDTQRRRIVRRISVTSGKLFSIAVLDSNQIAVAGSDNVIRVIDVDSGRTTRKLTGHHGSIPALSANGSILFSGGFDATLRRWSLTGVHDQQRIAEGDPSVAR